MGKLFVPFECKLAGGKRIRLEVSIYVKEMLEKTARRSRSQRRQDRRRHTEYRDGLTDTTSARPQEDFADLIFRMDRYRRLYAAIDKLSDEQRRRIILYYFCGLTYREIAAIERVSHQTAGRSVNQALNNLRKQFGV